jgi:hypothetical protein
LLNLVDADLDEDSTCGMALLANKSYEYLPGEKIIQQILWISLAVKSFIGFYLVCTLDSRPGYAWIRIKQ